ncbi:MAG: hypothetical protein PHS57_05895 [Alphaproteobacteria bacterium]|nr:hypothetical protein [Alphaproteobacteria bacterium]
MVREVNCCGCRKKFTAHSLLNNTVCPHCGETALIMLHICPECFDHLKGKAPALKPFKCPVCNGRGADVDGECPACKGKGVVWNGGDDG